MDEERGETGFPRKIWRLFAKEGRIDTGQAKTTDLHEREMEGRKRGRRESRRGRGRGK
jgi:hypothetical protein